MHRPDPRRIFGAAEVRRRECHARGEVDASGLKLSRIAGGGARLTFSPQWAEDHPRTAYLLREEADMWARQGALLLALN
jgi:hypothetical protein